MEPYSWEETKDGSERYISVFVPITGDASAKLVGCKILLQRVTLTYGGRVLLDGKLQFQIQPEDSYWEIETQKGERGVLIVMLKGDKWLKWTGLFEQLPAGTEQELWRQPAVWQTIEADKAGAGLHTLDPEFRQKVDSLRADPTKLEAALLDPRIAQVLAPEARTAPERPAPRGSHRTPEAAAASKPSSPPARLLPCTCR